MEEFKDYAILVSILGVVISIINLIFNFIINSKVGNLKLEYLYKARMPEYLNLLQSEFERTSDLLKEFEKNKEEIRRSLIRMHETINNSIRKLVKDRITQDDELFLAKLSKMHEAKFYSLDEYKSKLKEKGKIGRLIMNKDLFLNEEIIKTYVEKINGMKMRWENDLKDFEVTIN